MAGGTPTGEPPESAGEKAWSLGGKHALFEGEERAVGEGFSRQNGRMSEDLGVLAGVEVLRGDEDRI